jgi:hypothetical protein
VPPTLVPTSSASATPTLITSDATSGTPTVEVTEPSISSSEEDNTAQEEGLTFIIPACDFDRKVGYQCGDDTFVCNTDQYFTASEVCNVQAVPLHNGELYDWKDLGAECNNVDIVEILNVDYNFEPDCWCRRMSAGVSTHIVDERRSFPSNVACPNGRTVSSYVCYFPTQGGNSFKVNQWDVSGTGDGFMEECTGYQSRDTLPTIKETPVDIP